MTWIEDSDGDRWEELSEGKWSMPSNLDHGSMDVGSLEREYGPLQYRTEGMEEAMQYATPEDDDSDYAEIWSDGAVPTSSDVFRAYEKPLVDMAQERMKSYEEAWSKAMDGLLKETDIEWKDIGYATPEVDDEGRVTVANPNRLNVHGRPYGDFTITKKSTELDEPSAMESVIAGALIDPETNFKVWPFKEGSFPEEEVRVTDPETGGQKGQKLAQLGAIEPQALMEVAKVAGYGATKYARMNFLKGYSWSLSYDALQRHLMQFWAGEDRDEESGQYHLAHAAWHCMAMLAFMQLGRGTDDRPIRSLEEEE